MANLARLRMLEDLDGFLLVDKPSGIAFSTVVKVVRRKFNLVKAGHGGALDPAASGLLVVLVNGANRFAAEIMGADREYEGSMRLGLKTNTCDIHGETLSAAEPPAGGELARRIEAALPDFRGDVFQTESRWCSVRREGSAAYEIADTGEHEPFMAHVYRFAVEPLPDPGMAAFSLKCTKGLIVRSLVDDFGRALGCGAALAALRRTRTGRFSVADAIPFDRLLESGADSLPQYVIPVSRALA